MSPHPFRDVGATQEGGVSNLMKVTPDQLLGHLNDIESYIAILEEGDKRLRAALREIVEMSHQPSKWDWTDFGKVAQEALDKEHS